MTDEDDTDETRVLTPIPLSGVISRFYVRGDADIGVAGDTYTFRLRVNQTDSTITCQIVGAGGTELSCSDLTNSVTVSAGDLISISAFEPSGGVDPANMRFRWTARFVSN
jgi:hypothetical protein